jgi:hypothetical protein
VAFDFGGKGKAETQAREELRALATQIEAINQQLAEGAAVGGGAGGPALGKAFADLSGKLQYLYELVKTMEASVSSEVKERFTEVQKSVNTTLQKNLGDMYELHKGTQQTIDALHKRLEASPAFKTDEIGDMRRTLVELVTIYREEVQLFRKQNEFLQQKLLDIERKIDGKKT